MKINRATLNIIFIAVILLLFSGVVSGTDYITTSSFTTSFWPNSNYGTVGSLEIYNGTDIKYTYIVLPLYNQNINLSLFFEYVSAPFSIDVYTTSYFNESTITWNNQPPEIEYLTTFTPSDYIRSNITINSPSEFIILKTHGISAESASIVSDDGDGDPTHLPYVYLVTPITIYKPSGYVIDWNGIPVQDALVTFWGEDEFGNYHDVSQSTDPTGFYNITLPYDGIWDFVASKDGFADSQGWGYFSNNGTELTNITMYNVNIYGTVYDAKTHIPIVDASVDFIQADYYPNHSSYHASTLSDANGSYFLYGFLINKPIDIFASHDGYFQIENFSITPPQAGNYILDIYLMPDDPCPNNVCGLTVRPSFINSTFYYGANATLGNVPISNATVNLWNDTYSNSNLSLDWGYYQIPVYANGTYNINANKSSYATRGNENVTVVDYTAVKSLLLVCKGDINLDEYVNVNDFVLFACFYNTNSSGSNYYWLADFDNSTKINVDDFVQFATVYHTQCIQ